MNNDELISRTATHVRDELQADSTGHDWFHTERVWRMAQALAEKEAVDTTVTQLAALLHDIRDWKISGREHGSSEYARAWLSSLGADPELVTRVCDVIDAVSFLGEREKQTAPSLEAAVVQDADRLDALGAIGIARTFAYGGSKGRAIYDPGIGPHLGMNREEYRRHVCTSINHFHEKLLLLRDRMQTAAGREIADSRHQFMITFLEQFEREASAGESR